MVKVVHRKEADSSLIQEEELLLKKIDSGSRENEVARHAATLHLPYIDLSLFPLDGDDVRALNEDIARQTHATLFQRERGIYRFGLTQPTEDIKTMLTKIAEDHGQKVFFYLILVFMPGKL